MLLPPATSPVPSTPPKSPRKSSIEPLRVESFINDLFGEDLHASRVLSLTNATLGVLGAALLGVHAIGLALAEERGLSGKRSRWRWTGPTSTRTTTRH